MKKITTKIQPLNLASAGGQAVVKLLLRSGANIEGEDGRRDTPLMKAINSDQVEVVKLLISQGARIDRFEHGYSALHLSASRGNCEIASVLIDSGADVSEFDRMPDTFESCL